MNNNIQTSWTMSVGHQVIYKSIPLKNIAQKKPIWLGFLGVSFPSMEPLESRHVYLSLRTINLQMFNKMNTACQDGLQARATFFFGTLKES